MNLFIISVFLLSINSILGQTGTISGTVVEQSTQEPMQFAVVELFQEKDTASMFQGTTTDEDGEFEFKNVPVGHYFVKASFLGFETSQIPVFKHSTNTEIGTISIHPSEILLGSVTVKGEKNLLLNSIDKKVYQVQQDIASEGGSASEVLQNIPSVSVDIDGGVSLRGSSNITYLINGRPSALLRRSAANALQQIPAKSIDRIEIITNPSAKYKPDGIGGIINIVLRKESKQGINGQLTANAGNEGRYNTNLSLNYGTEEMNMFANYGFRHNAGTRFFTDKRTFKDSLEGQPLSFYEETRRSITDAYSHTISGGLNRELGDYNSFEISGDYFLQNGLHKGFSKIGSHDPTSQLLSQFTINQTNDELEEEGEVSASFEHVFKNNEDHVLTFEATHARFEEREDQTFDQRYTFPKPENTFEKNLVEKSGHQTEVKAEYVLPIGEEAELEAGYVGEFNLEDIRYTAFENYSRFLFNQDVHALYGVFGQGIEDFSFKAGLRLEQVNIRSHLVEPSDTTVPNSYLKLYPSVHMMYDLGGQTELRFSYSKRINRPDADELNPNPEFSDPRSAEAGNPNLKPEQVHSVELGFQTIKDKITFTPTLYYRYRYDAFTSIQKLVADSILLSTSENLDNQQSAGLEIILSGDIGRKLDLDFSADVFYSQLDAQNLGFSERKSVFAATAKLTSFYKLTSLTLLQLNAFYYSPRITPQGKRNQFFYLNAGVKQQLLSKQAAITLTATDVLHTYRIKRSTETPELSQASKYWRRQPIVFLGITWSFNKKNGDKVKSLDFEGLGG